MEHLNYICDNRQYNAFYTSTLQDYKPLQVTH